MSPYLEELSAELDSADLEASWFRGKMSARRPVNHEPDQWSTESGD